MVIVITAIVTIITTAMGVGRYFEVSGGEGNVGFLSQGSPQNSQRSCGLQAQGQHPGGGTGGEAPQKVLNFINSIEINSLIFALKCQTFFSR